MKWMYKKSISRGAAGGAYSLLAPELVRRVPIGSQNYSNPFPNHSKRARSFKNERIALSISIRLCAGTHYHAHTCHLFQQLNLLPLAKVIDVKTGTLMYTFQITSYQIFSPNIIPHIIKFIWGKKNVFTIVFQLRFSSR